MASATRADEVHFPQIIRTHYAAKDQAGGG
jgi:hypothetical protein